MSFRQVKAQDALVQVARDLTRSLSSDQRYLRLLEATRRVVDSDAAALFRLRGDGRLHPLAVRGLSAQTLGQVFDPAVHPRLQTILRSREPTVFAADDPRPDPFDGLLGEGHGQSFAVHSCMGCALVDGEEAIGVLTMDASEPGRFAKVDIEAVAAFASLAASAVRTAELIEALEQMVEKRGHIAQAMVQDELRRHGGGMIGRSESMRSVLREVEVVASTDLAVLITGETGTGKELVARSIHDRSRRRDRPLVYVNCAALPESVAESELFGHERGAFTGAFRARPGRFQMADGATIFLDEVGELPISIQTKLLRVLQFGEVQSVGADEMKRVDVRVIAATNRELSREVERGQFRMDLYHRLNAFQIALPPLREHIGDVALLAGHFLDLSAAKLGMGHMRLSPDALALLEQHDWPGNVRELEHVIMRGVLRAKKAPGADAVVEAAHLKDAQLTALEPGSPPPPPARTPGARPMALAAAVDQFKRRLIKQAVDEAGGNWAEAARALKVDRGNLQRLAQRLKLK